MPGLHRPIDQPALGPLQHAMPCLLRTAGAVGTSEQAAGSGHAGRDRPVQGFAQSARGAGVRAPYGDETTLSEAEVAFAVPRGLL